jgi:hypothetical protein
MTQTKKTSKRQAIDAFCKGCTYDALDVGTWRQQVEQCTVKTCPLWQHRPKQYQRKAKVDIVSESIAIRCKTDNDRGINA